MATDNLMTVFVAYAKQEKQCVIPVQVSLRCTIEMAICASRILDLFPEIDLSKQKVGIFSRLKSLSDFVSEGDRIEIYRPLTMDPKEARRKRAIK